MQVVFVYAWEFVLWAWRCGRGWIELGHKVKALEAEVAEQAARRKAADEELRRALKEQMEDVHRDRERLRQRIDDLDVAQVTRMDAIDRAQQERIDIWAQQLSSQINQVLVALASRTGNDKLAGQ